MNQQVLCNISNGTIEIANVPVPACKQQHLLVRSNLSMISTGTEKSLLSFGKSGLVEKARRQPEKVKQVLQKVRTDGLAPTIEAVTSKLDEPIVMGYSNVGVVVEVGEGVEGFSVGDRVLSNGAHASTICVPKRLCVHIPDEVSDEEAVFGVLGSISLHGFRLATPQIGDSVAVIGLGLVGLISMKIAHANGCNVVGFDVDAQKVDFARSIGFEAVNNASSMSQDAIISKYTNGYGFDEVLVAAASATSAPMEFGAQLCRKKGALVQIGVTKVSIPRHILFEKELSLQVSCSYGPGRYDDTYEGKGIDYPFPYVRWTEQRNFGAILDLLKSKRLSFSDLVGDKYSISAAATAYEGIFAGDQALATILSYGEERETGADRTIRLGETGRVDDNLAENQSRSVGIGAIGAGNYAGRTLLPAFAKTGVRLKTIASAGGVTGTRIGRKLGFEQSTTATDTVFNDPDINLVIVATQHNSHAHFVREALRAGKHVFVEKPLALMHSELDAIETELNNARSRSTVPMLMVGFNRRFAPLVTKLKAAIACSNSPMSIVYTCNAGAIPVDSWVQDPTKGGGRIIGEACHFVDMARFLSGSPIESVNAVGMDRGGADCHDTATISLKFENGSVATIHYFANGHKSFLKERIEVFQDGRVFQLDNFRKLRALGMHGGDAKKLVQDKGQAACCLAFIKAVETGTEAPIPLDEIMEVSRTCVDAWDQILHG